MHFDAAETRHLARVRRLRPGALLEAIDGAGHGFTVRLDALARDRASGVIVEARAPAGESPCAITLAAAILKGERMTWLVQKASELGVARIWPLVTARVVARPGANGEGARHGRWRRVAAEAVKQSRRSVTPAVDPPRGLDAVLDDVRAHDAAWLCWEGAGAPLGRVAAAGGPVRRLLLLVGPEGGFEPHEIARAEAAGARAVALGPRTLRAESAAIVAVALAQYLFGDLGGAGEGIR